MPISKIGLAALLNLAAVLSISVGLLNLLPIALLDGGHLACYAIEAARGKAVNERAKQFGIDIGLFLLMALVLSQPTTMCFACSGNGPIWSDCLAGRKRRL